MTPYLYFQILMALLGILFFIFNPMVGKSTHTKHDCRASWWAPQRGAHISCYAKLIAVYTHRYECFKPVILLSMIKQWLASLATVVTHPLGNM